MNTILELQFDPEGFAAKAAEDISRLTGQPGHDIAVVFGTGWDAAVDALGSAQAEFPMTKVTGFLAPIVKGHAGMIRSITIGQHRVLAFRGRTHLYEFPLGQGIANVVHAVRTAHATGCHTIILTNAVGGLDRALSVGQAVMIRDHNDIISGAPSPLLGAKFLDCCEVYDRDLRVLCRQVKVLPEVVYAQVRGPHFETPTAASFLRQNGIGIVGMSIIQEALMAHYLKMRVLAISLITDVGGSEVSHEEILGVVKAKSVELGDLLRGVIELI